MKTRSEKLKALLALAEKHAPQGVTHDGLTACDTIAAACDTIAAARQEIEDEEGRDKAFTELHRFAELVLSDLNDRKTGWYYQFTAAVEKVRNHHAPTV